MARKRLILIAGPTASGKTTLAVHLEQAHGAYRTKYSDILIEIADARGTPRTKEHLQRLSTQLRSEHGEEYLTARMREALRPVAHELIVIEGNRRMVDLMFGEDFAAEADRELSLVYVDADTGTRRARMNVRLLGQGAPTLTEDQFGALEADECENELPLVRAYLEHRGTVIDTTNTPPETLCALAERALKLTVDA